VLISVWETPLSSESEALESLLKSVKLLVDVVLVKCIVLSHVEVPSSCEWVSLLVENSFARSQVNHCRII
jgi:hypothetical protein